MYLLDFLMSEDLVYWLFFIVYFCFLGPLVHWLLFTVYLLPFYIMAHMMGHTQVFIRTSLPIWPRYTLLLK